MDHKQGNREQRAQAPVLYVAFELANNTWKMACSDGSRLRHTTVTAGDLAQVQGAIIKAKQHFGLGDKVHTVSCYEAGRDGFWLHRYLQSCGIDNVVVDSASLEVNRRLRRAKTDRVDAGKLLSMLIRYHGGEKQLWRLRIVEEQISSLVKEKTQRLKEGSARMVQVTQLQRLNGIGPVSSWTFVMEFFGWRRFQNRREVAALAGLTPTPYDSGKRLREQGISKAGNRRVRTLAIEIAWAWLRFQPQQVKPLVPGTVCRWREPHATHRHRGPGPAVAHRSVALSGVRCGPGRSAGKTTSNVSQNTE